MAVSCFVWLLPAIHQKSEMVHQRQFYLDLIEKGKLLAPIKLTDSPQYNWSAMLEKYSLSVVSMQPEGEGLSLICQGSYVSLLRFIDFLIRSSVDVTVVALSPTAYDLRILPKPLQLHAVDVKLLDVSMVTNPFEARAVVPPPFTLEHFLRANWVVAGYVRHHHYLCLYLNADDRGIMLYQGQRLFGEAWEVKVLTSQGVVMSNSNSGSTLRKQFNLPKALKSR